MRIVAGAILSLALFGMLAGGAWSNHDSRAPFAGIWDLDPNGRPGKLQLRLVSEAEGREVFEKRIVVIDPDCRGVLASKWYVGDFTTPNDHGPVAGCTDASFSGFLGFFKSTNFGGKVGKLSIPIHRGSSVFEALTSAAGDYSPPIEYHPLPMRFARHFSGDGAGEAVRRGLIRVAIKNKQFEPDLLTVVKGSTLRICNNEVVPREPYSSPKTGPNAFRVRLKPGQCFTRKLVNSGKAPIKVQVFDELVSQMKLTITIRPAK